MRLIGITGGVGAGKSELLQYIENNYLCKVYLADRVAHEIQMPGGVCYEQLVKLLGEEVLEENGCIDRAKMASMIFGDSGLLQKVNEIVHPGVQKYLLERVEEARRDLQTELFFIEAALLIEAGYKEIVDEMWYVYASEEVRHRRLRSGRGYTPEKIRQIMDSQLSEQAFQDAADFVIDNSGALEDSYLQIDERLKKYTRRAVQ